MTHDGSPTDDEVVAAFDAFLRERADAGVLLAAGAEVAFEAGTVTVTLHPETAVPDADALLSTSPYENHAQFAGMPIVFANEEGRWLRRVVKRVVTRLPDGADMGTLTAEELYRLGTGTDIPASD